MIRDALLNMIIGMGSVFAVLVLISLLIAALKIIPYIQNKLKAKQIQDIKTESATNTQVNYESYDVSNDTQLVAVITAAIMAYGNNTDSDFVVRSIKRR